MIHTVVPGYDDDDDDCHPILAHTQEGDGQGLARLCHLLPSSPFILPKKNIYM